MMARTAGKHPSITQAHLEQLYDSVCALSEVATALRLPSSREARELLADETLVAACFTSVTVGDEDKARLVYSLLRSLGISLEQELLRYYWLRTR